MKKAFLSLLAAVLIVSMIPLSAAADDDDYISPGSVIVPYANKDSIKIDGVLEKGEWSETNKIIFDSSNMISWTASRFTGPVEFYYSWCDDGLLMAAKSTDPYLKYNKAGTYSLNTQFQIALDPAYIIKDDYNGLFFSFFLDDSSNNVNATKHNWKSKNDDVAWIDPAEEPLYQGKYTVVKDGDTVLGWDMEVLLPWRVIASEDRKVDLDYDLNDAIPLTAFNPKDENRARAFMLAKVCYIGWDENNNQYGAGTFTDGVIGWETDTYDIVLLLALPGETDRSTETEYFTLGGDTTDGVTVTETEAEAKTTAEDTTEPATGKTDDTDAAPQTATGNTTDVETKTVSGGSKGGFPFWVIIAAAGAAAVATVFAIIIRKKKKA